MGNVMTPFFPPKAAFIPKLVNLLASGPYTNLYYVDITAAQAENNIFYLSGSATNPGSSASLAFVFFNLPTTTLTKVYTFSAGNITTSTAFNYTFGISVAGTVADFNLNTSFQVAYSATGYGTGGVPTVKVITASNIYFTI